MDSCQKQTPCTFGKLAEESPLVGTHEIKE